MNNILPANELYPQLHHKLKMVSLVGMQVILLYKKVIEKQPSTKVMEFTYKA